MLSYSSFILSILFNYQSIHIFLQSILLTVFIICIPLVAINCFSKDKVLMKFSFKRTALWVFILVGFTRTDLQLKMVIHIMELMVLSYRLYSELNIMSKITFTKAKIVCIVFITSQAFCKMLSSTLLSGTFGDVPISLVSLFIFSFVGSKTIDHRY